MWFPYYPTTMSKVLHRKFPYKETGASQNNLKQSKRCFKFCLLVAASAKVLPKLLKNSYGGALALGGREIINKIEPLRRPSNKTSVILDHLHPQEYHRHPVPHRNHF